jgi:hypothetical protein
MDENGLKKRGPGRPPSDIKKIKEIRSGITLEPKNPRNIVEFYYVLPMVIKKLFILYKNTHVTDIYLQFDLDKMTFIANTNTMQMMTVIDCKKIHRYYCKRPICLKMSCIFADSIINRIDDKYYDSITINVEDASVISSISVILYEPKMDMVNTNKLNLDMVDLLTINHLQWDENTYPLNITIEYPHFKKYISDIYNIAKEFTIEKVGNYPVNLKYAQREGAVTSVNAFKDHSKLHVKGHIEPH